MSSPEKGKARENPARARKKASHIGKGNGESKVEHTRFDGECRNLGKHDHKAADCWYKHQHKPQGKGQVEIQRHRNQ